MFGRKFRGTPTPAAPAGAPKNPQPAPAIGAPATPPSPAMRAAPAAQTNLSDAIGQLKAGNKFDAQNTLRKTVGLSEIAPPPAIEKPQLSDAIGRLKMGDRASAEAMMRKMVGLKKGGKVSKSSKGSSSSSASRRGDGIASKGKTKGRMV